MTPMRSQVELWRPSDLTVTASNLDGFRRSIVDVVETMRNDVDGMAPDWSGIAFDAAARRADDEYDEVRRLGRTIQAIVDAYNEGARELESVLGVPSPRGSRDRGTVRRHRRMGAHSQTG